MIGLLLLLN